MDNKKIFLSFILIIVVALSASVVSAQDTTSEDIAADANDNLAVNDQPILSEDKQPASADAKGITDAIGNASEGDTIDLSAFANYDVSNSSITVDKKLTIKGNGTTTITGAGDGNGIFYVQANGVTFQGIKFICNNPNSVLTYYDDATKDQNQVFGIAIYFKGGGAQNGLVDGCSFDNFNSGVRIQSGANGAIVKNSYFTGVTNYLRNDPTVNVEKGTKAVNVMGSANILIQNNTFEGPMLDGVSVASAAGASSIINNTFIGNSYAIYFGGASTDNTVIKGNKYKNCGHFEGIDAKTGNPVTWIELPLISIQKAATGLEISNNEIEAVNNTVVIAAEAGNGAHGYPSEIGNIIVSKNTITKYSADVNTATVVLLHILSRNGELNPTEDINVTDNVLNGAKAVVYWNTLWGNENGQISIPSMGLAPTFFKITSINSTALVGSLIDLNSEAVNIKTLNKQGQITKVTGETITYTMNGVTESYVLDENGVFNIPNPNGTIFLAFAGNDKVAASNLTINYEVPASSLVATNITVKDLNIKAEETGNLEITLKDANGILLANKEIIVVIDGVAKTVKTNDSGVAVFEVKYATSGTYNAVISYEGDDATKASLATTKIVVSKKATTLTAPKATAKAKKATKIKITLKSEGKALANKKITIKVKGKTFTGVTNAAGVATISVKVAKKGSTSYTATFAGDGVYQAISKKAKIVVKK